MLSRSHGPFDSLKPTVLVDTATNAIVETHVTTTQKHDTQIAQQVVKRNVQSTAVLTADKESEWATEWQSLLLAVKSTRECQHSTPRIP